VFPQSIRPEIIVFTFVLDYFSVIGRGKKARSVIGKRVAPATEYIMSVLHAFQTVPRVAGGPKVGRCRKRISRRIRTFRVRGPFAVARSFRITCGGIFHAHVVRARTGGENNLSAFRRGLRSYTAGSQRARLPAPKSVRQICH